MMLADMGADVIKVERSPAGDDTHEVPREHGFDDREIEALEQEGAIERYLPG